MNDNNLSVSRILRILGALILDAVMVIIFVKEYHWFALLAPAESILMMLVLIFGLIAVDWVIIAPPMYKKVGVAYTAALCVLLVLYAVTANVVSILTIWVCRLIWYAVWQLLILGIFVLILAVVAAFARRAGQDIAAGNVERAARGNTALLLADMHNTLSARAGDPAVVPVAAAFRALKERLNASTPFGRIQGNPGVTDLEYRIMGNLNLLQNELRLNLTAENAAKIVGMMEDTRRMVISRESLNIQ